jgi:hypothetical protein
MGEAKTTPPAAKLTGHVFIRVFADHEGFCGRCRLDEKDARGKPCEPLARARGEEVAP